MRYRCMCLVLHAPQDLRLDEQQTDEIGPGQVLVRVGLGGICGSDLHYFHHGGFGAIRIQEPIVLGHEVAHALAHHGAERLTQQRAVAAGTAAAAALLAADPNNASMTPYVMAALGVGARLA